MENKQLKVDEEFLAKINIIEQERQEWIRKQLENGEELKSFEDAFPHIDKCSPEEW